MEVSIYILVSIIGALLSRWHGGGFLKAPKWLRNLVWSIPFSAIIYFVTNSVVFLLLCLSLSVATKSLGHGRIWNPYLPIDNTVSPERIESLIYFLKGRLSSFWYKVIGLSLLGGLSTSGLYIPLFIEGHTVLAISSLLLGILSKPLGYLIGWKQPYIANGNEVGEYITGFIAFLPLCLVVEYLLLK